MLLVELIEPIYRASVPPAPITVPSFWLNRASGAGTRWWSGILILLPGVWAGGEGQRFGSAAVILMRRFQSGAVTVLNQTRKKAEK